MHKDFVCGYQYWLGWVYGLCVCFFYVREHPKAQPAVVLVLKRRRRRDHNLKSHPTDWESRESNSGLLGTRRVTNPLHQGGTKILFVAVFLGYNVSLCFLWFYAQEQPKAQPAVVLVLKRLRRRGHSLSLIRQPGRSRESNLQPLVYKT